MSQRSNSHARQRRLERDSPVAVGDLVAGKYRIEILLASGGMGVVAAARHEVLDQRFAIKFLLPRMVDAEQTAVRFLREAKAAARIRSQHVVRVFDCGELEDGIPYMVMEHLEGIELSKAMSRRGPWPPTEAIEVILGALEGAAEAHATGVVHRDLKPSNLFLEDGPGGSTIVKVLDFGISKIQPGVDEPVQDDLTQTSMMLGSPRYISPEQARNSRDVDGRSDIWSLGVILYQLLDGSAPFNGDTIGELLSQILLHHPEPLHLRRDNVPEGLAQVVERCLQRDREDRFADVGELALALAPFAEERALAQAERIAAIVAKKGPQAPRASGRGDEAPSPTGNEAETKVTPTPIVNSDVAQSVSQRLSQGTVTQGTWAHTGSEPSRRNGFYLAVLGGLFLLGTGAYAGWRWSSAEPPAPSLEPTPAGEMQPPAEPQRPRSSSTPSASAVASVAAPAASASAPTPTATATASAEPTTPRNAWTKPPPLATTAAPPPPRPPSGTDNILEHSD